MLWTAPPPGARECHEGRGAWAPNDSEEPGHAGRVGVHHQQLIGDQPDLPRSRHGRPVASAPRPGGPLTPSHPWRPLGTQSTLAPPCARWSPRGWGVSSVSGRRRRLRLASNRTINPDLHDLLLAAGHHAPLAPLASTDLPPHPMCLRGPEEEGGGLPWSNHSSAWGTKPHSDPAFRLKISIDKLQAFVCGGLREPPKGLS